MRGIYSNLSSNITGTLGGVGIVAGVLTDNDVGAVLRTVGFLMIFTVIVGYLIRPALRPQAELFESGYEMGYSEGFARGQIEAELEAAAFHTPDDIRELTD